MSSTPREIGTLIVVVLRANHLPNKRHIGKQDPYCLVTVNGEKRRTKAIKRGGQHPEWDEEIRFTLFEDVDDVFGRSDFTAPAPPPKDDKKFKKIKGGKIMKVACYADDLREPDLIGDVDVDLTEVLTKGETDEWFTLTNKDKFAGKVYLELTFWSNEPPPEKKAAPKPAKNNKQYGGPGSFIPSGELPGGSRGAAYNDHSRQNSDVLPSSLRVSGSAANLDLYVAPYERNHNSHIENITREFSEFGMSGAKRRESYPIQSPYTQEPQHIGSTYSTFSNYPPNAYVYDQNTIPETGSAYTYDRPVTPNGQHPQHYQHTSNGYSSQSYQQPVYDANSPTSYPPMTRGPRHSVPTSSGFMPIPQASGFVPITSHQSEPSGFVPPPSHTPAPNNYNASYNSQPQSVYLPPVSHTPAPVNNGSYLQHSTSLSFIPQQPYPPSQSYNYNYGIPSSVSAPHQFISPPPTQSSMQLQNQAPSQIYTPMSPSHEISSGQVPPPPPPQVPHTNGQSARPLPQQPQVVYNQSPVQSPPITSSHSLPPPSSIAQTVGSYSPTQPGNIYPSNTAYSPIPPPPPPPPPHQYNTAAPVMTNTTNLSVPPPPPPPPPSSLGSQPHRRASLPQPPVTYQQQPQQTQVQQHQTQEQPLYLQGQPLPIPPPPPPPIDYYGGHNRSPLPPPPPPLYNQTGMTQNGSYEAALPPKPPQVDEYGQWIQPNSSLQTSQAY